MPASSGRWDFPELCSAQGFGVYAVLESAGCGSSWNRFENLSDVDLSHENLRSIRRQSLPKKIATAADARRCRGNSTPQQSLRMTSLRSPADQGRPVVERKARNCGRDHPLRLILQQVPVRLAPVRCVLTTKNLRENLRRLATRNSLRSRLVATRNSSGVRVIADVSMTVLIDSYESFLGQLLRHVRASRTFE